jgi:ferredoxin
MRIVVDHDRCTGLGMCEAEAPELFEVQDDGSLSVLDETLRPPRSWSRRHARRARPVPLKR